MKPLSDESYISSLLNYGSSLIREDPVVARSFIKSSLLLAPTSEVGLFNLGLALHEQKKISSAIRSYRLALTCSHEHRDAILNNLAQDMLLDGQLQEGLELYEHRLSGKYQSTFREFTQKFGRPWDGPRDSRPVDRLIVASEQGYGDTLQYCRYILTLQDMGIKASLFSPLALAPLLREGSSIKSVLTAETSSGHGIRWCPLMSLPWILRNEIDTVPLSEGYLRPLEFRTKEWCQKLQRDPQKRLVAIHWQGNPKFERSIYSRGRSIGLAGFSSLLEFGKANNIEFLSIQKGHGAEQLAMLRNQIQLVKGQNEFDKSLDFRDTAAALMNCDLLISSDSSVVHLAGCLGINCWVALSWIPEWRWGLDGSSSPWYKSVRLYRQRSRDDWESAIGQMIEDLGRSE